MKIIKERLNYYQEKLKFNIWEKLIFDNIHIEYFYDKIPNKVFFMVFNFSDNNTNVFLILNKGIMANNYFYTQFTSHIDNFWEVIENIIRVEELKVFK